MQRTHPPTENSNTFPIPPLSSSDKYSRAGNVAIHSLNILFLGPDHAERALNEPRTNATALRAAVQVASATEKSVVRSRKLQATRRHSRKNGRSPILLTTYKTPRPSQKLRQRLPKRNISVYRSASSGSSTESENPGPQLRQHVDTASPNHSERANQEYLRNAVRATPRRVRSLRQASQHPPTSQDSRAPKTTLQSLGKRRAIRNASLERSQ